MGEEKNLFGMCEDITAGQAEILSEIIGVKAIVSDTDSKISKLEKEIQELKNRPTVQHRPVINAPQRSKKEILQMFLKQAKKSWMWFGNRAEFKKWKTLAIVSLIILLIMGFTTTIVSSICFKLYSAFTLFENAWMVFGIIYLVYASKTQRIYEVNSLVANSSTKYEKDNLGMVFAKKEKVVFVIFRWLAIISIICNIIVIWIGLGQTIQVFATIMEALYLGAIIFAYFMNLNLFAQYSIIYIEGNNLTTKERVVLVLPPGAKELMPEEDFKKKMPFFYD